MNKKGFLVSIFLCAMAILVAVQISIPTKNSFDVLAENATDTVIDTNAVDKKSKVDVQIQDTDNDLMIITDEQVPLAGEDLQGKANDSMILSLKFLLFTVVVGTGAWAVALYYKERRKNEEK